MNQAPAIIHDIRGFYGAHTTAKVLELFDAGLPEGEHILCHHLYRIRMGKQTRTEIYHEALDIQSYVCLELPRSQNP